jgi:ATP/maltotriose-dependent transcriptional regulator MalT
MTDAAKRPSVFGFLKSIVAEEVPDKPTRNTPVPKAPSPGPHEDVHHDSPAGPVPPDAQALAKLEARLQAACPAPYAAFMEQYELLKEDIADERTRFKVALKTTHTTADDVTGALDQLLSVMQKAKDEFMHSFDETRQKKMGAAQEAIAAGQQLIASSEEQIKTIQEKIASLRTKHETDVRNMLDEGHRLDAIRDGFGAAHAQVVSRLEDQKRRIDSMPKG